MIYGIPVIGWFLGGLASISMAIPFYFIWNALGSTYFYFVPAVYHQIPFWHCVGLFMLMSMLKSLLIPKLASVTNTSNSNT